MSKQPEALRLADGSEAAETWEYEHTDKWIRQAAAELRRLHSINAELFEALRLVIANFPTDGDMTEAGWTVTDIDAACRAYDEARSAIRKATEEA